MDLSLTGRTTRLKFDDFVSDPIPLDNSTMQGDPSSMLYYSFYNAPLIEVAASASELSPGFVDDSIMLAISDTIEDCHSTLKDIMERPGRGFKWSFTHNSPFELSKTALMNFPRSYRDHIPGGLSLDKPNADGMITTSVALSVLSYKYLGILFDPRLRRSLQHAKALATATFLSSQLWRISKSASGLSITGTKQLFNTVAVLRFTYGAEVWYTYLHKPESVSNTRGSVAITNKLRSVQRKVAKAITGGLSTTAGDIMDVHTHIFPVDLLFCKLLFWAMLHLCSLPSNHPLHPCIRSAARRKAKRHLLPLHHLINFAGLKHNDIETISPVRRSPGYNPAFNIVIPPSKEAVLPLANLTNSTIPVQVYSDGSGYEGGIGASVLLYINDWLARVLHFYLGTAQEHTVYEAEGVGLIMGLHLLHGLSRRLIQPMVLGMDIQAVTKALKNLCLQSGYYLLDAIHLVAEHLQAKQDGLINSDE